MCVHKFKQINDVRVCVQCGLTLPKGGRPFFDKEVVRLYSQKKKRGKRHG